MIIIKSNYALKREAKSPVSIKAGGDILDGHIYFSSGSRLCSYRLKTGWRTWFARGDRR